MTNEEMVALKTVVDMHVTNLQTIFPRLTAAEANIVRLSADATSAKTLAEAAALASVQLRTDFNNHILNILTLITNRLTPGPGH